MVERIVDISDIDDLMPIRSVETKADDGMDYQENSKIKSSGYDVSKAVLYAK